MGMLVALSIVLPAASAQPARMTVIRRAFEMDYWYLAPLYLTDRLGGGALWAVALIAGVVLATIPWWMVRRRMAVAAIEPARCTACAQCDADCPYNAIAMVPRTDGSSKYDSQAYVDPTKCVGCGICAASCDTLGTNLAAFSTVDYMRRLDGWVPIAAVGSEPREPLITVFHCAHAAGADFATNPQSGECVELPGARVLAIPCVGWLHALTLERVLRRGAAHAVVVSCGPGGCHFREGDEWLRQRVAGERGPSPREQYAPQARMHILQLDRTQGGRLRDAVAALRAGGTLPCAPHARGRTRFALGIAAAALAGLLAAVVGAGSRAGYASPNVPGSELVVTFKHPGQVSEEFHVFTPQELAKIPVHMRRARSYRRARANVRLRVQIDGRMAVERSFAPKGLWHDGNSIAVERLIVPLGVHHITVEIGDAHERENWSFRTEQRLEFTREALHVIAFDRLSGFVVH
jgi:ferredoxin